MTPTKRRPVLVIDDEPDLVAVLSSRLSRAGFSVATAADGEDGLRQAAAVRPIAILLDIAMPKLDGWGFCSRLRRDAALSETPVMILTAWLSDDLKKKAEAAGAAGIMLKPYDEGELIRQLRLMASCADER